MQPLSIIPKPRPVSLLPINAKPHPHPLPLRLLPIIPKPRPTISPTPCRCCQSLPSPAHPPLSAASFRFLLAVPAAAPRAGGGALPGVRHGGDHGEAREGPRAPEGSPDGPREPPGSSRTPEGASGSFPASRRARAEGRGGCGLQGTAARVRGGVWPTQKRRAHAQKKCASARRTTYARWGRGLYLKGQRLFFP